MTLQAHACKKLCAWCSVRVMCSMSSSFTCDGLYATKALYSGGEIACGCLTKGGYSVSESAVVSFSERNSNGSNESLDELHSQPECCGFCTKYRAPKL